MKRYHYVKINANKRDLIKEPTRYNQQKPYYFKPIRFSDKEYAKIMQSLIIVCTDALIIDCKKQTIFLAKRRAKPAAGEWWYIGGRTFAGETFKESVQRCFKRETKLKLPISRFKFINTQVFIFNERQQYPQNLGYHAISFVFVVELTSKERIKVASSLGTAEYKTGTGLKKFSRQELVKERVHPAIIESYDRVFKINKRS